MGAGQPSYKSFQADIYDNNRNLIQYIEHVNPGDHFEITYARRSDHGGVIENKYWHTKKNGG
eukprot:8589515-Pyramimonas_sp.AAC.1